MRAGAAAMTTTNLAEAVDVSCRGHGLDERSVKKVVEPLIVGDHLSVIAPSDSHAWRAAQLRIAHYSRNTRPLSMVDCFLLAAAGPGDRIATADPAVAEVARAEGISLIALPDSSGR